MGLSNPHRHHSNHDSLLDSMNRNVSPKHTIHLSHELDLRVFGLLVGVDIPQHLVLSLDSFVVLFCFVPQLNLRRMEGNFKLWGE